MGRGTIGFKKLPAKKKVYGDKEFHIRPITYGFKPTYNAIAIRPSGNEDLPFDIEGEFGTGEYSYNLEKKDYENAVVKYIYFQKEADKFTPAQLEKVKSYCDFSI